MVRGLLSFLWLLSGVAFLIAVAAFARTRRVSKRLERLSESYWELRYEHGQLRSQIARIEPASSDHVPAQPASGDHVPASPAAGVADPAQPAPGGRDLAPSAFVPLSSLKRPRETTLDK